PRQTGVWLIRWRWATLPFAWAALLVPVLTWMGLGASRGFSWSQSVHLIGLVGGVAAALLVPKPRRIPVEPAPMSERAPEA
ncbi:MAG: hypothetical protein KY476_26285, partial [Planctomycetes bacterium]|nr:hypothetical protein [Planctomycetota bacterium]